LPNNKLAALSGARLIMIEHYLASNKGVPLPAALQNSTLKTNTSTDAAMHRFRLFENFFWLLSIDAG
jgi:hypothetical protein